MRDEGGGTLPPTVLVADDSAALRSLVRITVASQGWSVVEATTGAEALALARRTHPDLVILDVDFGDGGPDGIAVCTELRRDPRTKDLAVVVLTAHDEAGERGRAEAAGANAFVSKPFGPLDLMHVLTALMPATRATPTLGVLLLDAGALQPDHLEEALREQRALESAGTPKRLGDVLVERGVVSEEAVDRALLEQVHAKALARSERQTRVLIIDDRYAVREGLRALLEPYPDMALIGNAPDASEGLRLARRHHPDVVVLDNEMPGGNGLEVLPALRNELPDARIVMFSLTNDARALALERGADAFVVKEAAMGEILAAIRPAPAPGQASVPPVAGVPAFHRQRHLRRAVIVIAAALAAYAIVFLALESQFGAGAGAFSILPVFVIGALLGPEGGLVGAALTLLLTFALWSATGHEIGEPVLQIGAPGLGIVILLLLGVGAGSMHQLGLRLDPRRRRVEAVATAAQVLAGLEREDLVTVLLDAVLEVVPAGGALLYANAAGEPRFVVASHDTGPVDTDRGVAAARDVMRATMPKIVVDAPEGDRPVLWMRSAALVPVSIAGEDARGVIALVDGRPGRFTEADIALIRPFAHYLWLLMRLAPFRSPVTIVRGATEPTH